MVSQSAGDGLQEDLISQSAGGGLWENKKGSYGMEPVIRKMTTQDLEWMEEAERRCFSEPWSLRLLEEMLDGQLDEAWILETETGEPAAYANFRFLSGEGELMRIAVLPEYRGRGYSRKLMERLEESARAAGAQELTLEVRESNEAALHLYKSCGFRVEAVRKDYYRNPKENALILWKRGFLGIPT